MMEALKELAQVVSKQKIKRLEVIGFNMDEDTKLNLLYEGILDGLFETDEDAAKELYDKSEKSAAYRKLKTRLEDRLHNTIFFIEKNSPTYVDYSNAYRNCHKNWAVLRILMENGAKHAALKLAHRTIKAVDKYSFTDLKYLIGRELAVHYNQWSYDKSKGEQFEEMMLSSFTDLSYENEVFKYHIDFAKLTVSSRASVGEKFFEMYPNLTKRLREILDKTDSVRASLMTYLLLSYLAQIEKDYEKNIDVSSEALEYFKSLPFLHPIGLIAFSDQLLMSYLQLNMVKEGLETIEELLELHVIHDHNWFLIQYLHFQILMHDAAYQDAYSVLVKVINDKNFNKLFPEYKEIWSLNEAFIQFLIATGKVDPEKSDAPELPEFRLYRFLNDVPIFSKDKQGLNITLLILHVLFLLQMKKWNDVIDRVDALNQYCYRYLRKDETFRSNCFIKMLLQIPRADFHPLRAQRYAEKFRKRLDEVPKIISESSSEIEIIPYEDLWDIVIELLEKQ